jgi:hypothetical protein
MARSQEKEKALIKRIRAVPVGEYFLLVWDDDPKQGTCGTALYERVTETEIKCQITSHGVLWIDRPAVHLIDRVDFDSTARIHRISDEDAGTRIMLAIHGQGAKAMRMGVGHG